MNLNGLSVQPAIKNSNDYLTVIWRSNHLRNRLLTSYTIIKIILLTSTLYILVLASKIIK